MSETKLTINGLREFNKALKDLDSKFPAMVRLALNKAVDAVIDEARPTIPTRTGRAQRSLRSQSSRTAARVVAGGPKAPYYPWLDFGGRVGRKKRTKRTFYTDGRYLYPTYFRMRDSGDFVEIMSKALIEVAESAGLKVEHG